MGELISKVKMMEELRNKMKIQDGPVKVLGKRSFGYFRGKNYEMGSGSGPGVNKKPSVERIQSQEQGK